MPAAFLLSSQNVSNFENTISYRNQSYKLGTTSIENITLIATTERTQTEAVPASIFIEIA